MALGEATGGVAALAARDGGGTLHLDVRALQTELLRRGSCPGEPSRLQELSLAG
jgi:hypothetical protein